jgi:hypothetical protein
MANYLAVGYVTSLRAAVLETFIVIEARSGGKLLCLNSGRNKRDADKNKQDLGKTFEHNTS